MLRGSKEAGGNNGRRKVNVAWRLDCVLNVFYLYPVITAFWYLLLTMFPDCEINLNSSFVEIRCKLISTQQRSSKRLSSL